MLHCGDWGGSHDSLQAEHAVKLAQDAGFTNINLDLIVCAARANPCLKPSTTYSVHLPWRLTHLSYYQLTLEPNTVFYARPPQGIPDDDAAWEMQEHTQRLLAEAGYQHYEVSAYAREGWQCLQ